MEYPDFCESLFQDWLNQNITEYNLLSELFQLEYAPEPIFQLAKGNSPLYMLLTNPGAGMKFQLRENFSGSSRYQAFADILSYVYLSDTFKSEGGANAYRRLTKSIEFAQHLGYNGLINIETIPFHSPDLNKSKALRIISKSQLLQEYLKHLSGFIEDKPALVVSACSSKESISEKTIAESEWLTFQANLVGFSLSKAQMRVLTEKEGKVSSAIFTHGNKYFVLMMGSNNLPSINNL